MTSTNNPTTVNHPLENGQQMVMVRNTASGFEQGIAAVAGLCTAGPLGALASWGALRGLQGKWAPWVILGVPLAPILIVVQLTALAVVTPTMVETPAPETTQSQVYKR